MKQASKGLTLERMMMMMMLIQKRKLYTVQKGQKKCGTEKKALCSQDHASS
jgi:hypothetical protein